MFHETSYTHAQYPSWLDSLCTFIVAELAKHLLFHSVDTLFDCSRYLHLILLVLIAVLFIPTTIGVRLYHTISGH